MQQFAYKLNWVWWKSSIISLRPAKTCTTWLDELKDLKALIVIQRRIDRVGNGNFGDRRFCEEGVWELKIDFGPGYRVYYAQAGATIVLLLCGGSKLTQSADIKEAVRYWRDYQRRKK